MSAVELSPCQQSVSLVMQQFFELLPCVFYDSYLAEEAISWKDACGCSSHW